MSRALGQLRWFVTELRRVPAQVRRETREIPGWVWRSYALEWTALVCIVMFAYLTKSLWASLFGMLTVSVFMTHIRTLTRRHERDTFFDIVDREENDDLWELTEDGDENEEDDDDDGEW